MRPGYPAEIAALLDEASLVVDVAAGTGKFTEALLARNPRRPVLALDVSRDMLRIAQTHLPVPCWQATAENTALARDSVAAVACAQAWHWLDIPAVCREFDRVISPHGVGVVLAWNTIDVHATTWSLGLTRVMHSGDVLRPGFYPTIASPWTITREVRTTFTQELTVPQLHQLMATRSYWLRANAATRERLTTNLDAYLAQIGFGPKSLIPLPYRSDGFLLQRA